MGNKEIQLLELLRTDYQQGISMLIDLYGGAVKSICSHILRGCGGSLTDDAVQTTFVKLWQALCKEQLQVNNLKAYIYQTARNCSLNILRNYKAHCNLSLDDPEYTGIEEISYGSTESTVDNKEIFQTVHNVIDKMKEPDRTIFLLRFFYNYTVKEIAGRLHLKEDNVESRIRRNKKKLREKLKERDVFYE